MKQVKVKMEEGEPKRGPEEADIKVVKEDRNSVDLDIKVGQGEMNGKQVVNDCMKVEDEYMHAEEHQSEAEKIEKQDETGLGVVVPTEDLQTKKGYDYSTSEAAEVQQKRDYYMKKKVIDNDEDVETYLVDYKYEYVDLKGL